MRILHIIDSLSMGGAENLVCNLAVQQQLMGNKVYILQLTRPNTIKLENILKEQRIGIYTLSGAGVYDIRHIFRIKRFLRQKFDIVHVHLFPALYWAGLANNISFSKNTLVYTEHSTNNKRRGYRILKAIDKYIYKNCYKEVVACADKVLETYQKTFPTVKSSVIPNGIEVERFATAVPYSKTELIGVSEDTFVITMVARFASMKRQDTLVEAAKLLPPSFHFVFVGGDGGELNRVKSLAKQLGVYDRIHFLGVRNDVPQILKTSDVNILASDYEGLSLSSLEGMACGVPFVATDVDGLREIVGGYGVLYENKNFLQLAEILIRLQKDKEYYKQVSMLCSQRSKEFDIKNVAEKYHNVYKKYVKEYSNSHQ